MTATTNPTAYWVIRDNDDETFDLRADRDTAEKKAQYYADDTGEPFRVAPEYRDEMSYWDLPNSWATDWRDRVPDAITVTSIPEEEQR